MSTDRRQSDRRKAQVPVATERRQGERRRGDRRRAARAPLDLWVEEERGNELYFRRTGNVSTGGVYFEQAIPHAVGTHVKLRFSLPDDPEVIEAEGEIVSASNDASGLGMGLKFLAMSAAHKRRLAAFIATQDEDVSVS